MRNVQRMSTHQVQRGSLQISGLHGRNFCFFHDRLHSDALGAKFGPLMLPVSEDFSSILLALNRISSAIIDSRIDAKRAAQLIWIQQLALQVVNRRDSRNDESIQTIAQDALGEELAPPLTLCEPGDECQTCAHNKICARSPYADRFEADDGTEYQYEPQRTVPLQPHAPATRMRTKKKRRKRKKPTPATRLRGR